MTQHEAAEAANALVDAYIDAKTVRFVESGGQASPEILGAIATALSVSVVEYATACAFYSQTLTAEANEGRK